MKFSISIKKVSGMRFGMRFGTFQGLHNQLCFKFGLGVIILVVIHRGMLLCVHPYIIFLDIMFQLHTSTVVGHLPLVISFFICFVSISFFLPLPWFFSLFSMFFLHFFFIIITNVYCCFCGCCAWLIIQKNFKKLYIA